MKGGVGSLPRSGDRIDDTGGARSALHPEVAVDPVVIVVMTAVTGLFMLGVLYAVIRTQR